MLLEWSPTKPPTLGVVACGLMLDSFPHGADVRYEFAVDCITCDAIQSCTSCMLMRDVFTTRSALVGMHDVYPVS